MEQNEIKEYRILYIEDGEIKDNGTRWGELEQLQADFPGLEWVIIPAEEVPENWRDMTIETGRLIPAPAEVIEARRMDRMNAETEAIRAARESRYRAETDALMVDAIETFAIAHPDDPAFAQWLAAKDIIRQELPKPETAKQEGGVPQRLEQGLSRRT